ncbi:MAG: LysM peptidoglycan-binding domain-containing protein [Anaerolineales bacterium]|nr:LysM peptidoglycan-binding domain-containing protein [Chloroflexota bacterium]MBL6981309.1 LysM peptidoglycan-binding domain-containing protein [Anaerolineales bacterium]
MMHIFSPRSLRICGYILTLFTLVLFLAGCNMPRQQGPFVAPSEFEPTTTPNWAATIEAAPTITASPTPKIPVEEHTLTEQPTATAEIVEPSPTPQPTIGNTPTVSVNTGPILYYTQSGDTLDALAVRFGVTVDEIDTTGTLPDRGFINPNQLLIIPRNIGNTTSPMHLLPDSEFVYTLSALDFNVVNFVSQAGGYLKNFHEYLGTHGETYGGDIVEQIALDNSVSPKLLLALLEYQSGWVYGQPANLADQDYPLGEISLSKKGLLRQLKWAVNELSVGYYGWREGRLSEIQFSDGVLTRLAPDLNAGTAALQYYFSKVYDSQGWLAAMDPETGFPAFYEQMFGNPWTRAQVVEPLFPPDLVQPDLVMPFLVGRSWSYTGGPHGAFEKDGSWAAIDFAPATTVSGCYDSDAWVTASGDGVISRSERGIVVLDLDGDGFEQTGWALIYLHIADEGRTGAGRLVKKGDLLGHPSCEGGFATGTHVHMARKYNGEWMQADGPIPFVLSGWTVHSTGVRYKGSLTRDGEVVTASQYGAHQSLIERDRE